MGSRRETEMLAFAKAMRSCLYKWVESLGCDPKPGDLDVGRLKRNESYVEDR